MAGFLFFYIHFNLFGDKMKLDCCALRWIRTVPHLGDGAPIDVTGNTQYIDTNIYDSLNSFLAIYQSPMGN